MDDARGDPARPSERISLRKGGGDRSGPGGPGGPDEPIDVGEFRQGSPVSQWALARYLVGRAIGESVGASLMIVAVVLLALAALIWWAGSVFWAVVVGVIALGVLLMRALMLAVLRRLTAARQYGQLEERMRSLVADTRGDVLRELRRIGLPGHTWTLPLLGVRLVRRTRRADTLERLKRFQLGRAVPRARLDELHLLLRSAMGGLVPPPAGR
ncbi:MAG: hypothetical protein ABI301_01660 [Jatrophihabitantaceae bacterium]